MHYVHKNSGTCSTQVEFDLEDGKLYNVKFTGGCNGNLQGICKLVEGEDAAVIKEKILGIRCGWKPTSCPDQLARAISEALNL